MSMGGGIAGATPASAMAGMGMPGSTQTAAGFQPGAPEDTNADRTGSNDRPGKCSRRPNLEYEFAGGPERIEQPLGLASDCRRSDCRGNQHHKAKSIREFGGKNHYNQWQFIYDPARTAGKGLINTPAQRRYRDSAKWLTLQGHPGTQAGEPTSGFGQNPSAVRAGS